MPRAKAISQTPAAQSSDGIETKGNNVTLQALEKDWDALVRAHMDSSHRSFGEAEVKARRNPANEKILSRLIILRNVLKWHQRLQNISTHKPYPGDEAHQRTRIADERDLIRRECASALRSNALTDDDRAGSHRPASRGRYRSRNQKDEQGGPW